MSRYKRLAIFQIVMILGNSFLSVFAGEPEMITHSVEDGKINKVESEEAGLLVELSIPEHNTRVRGVPLIITITNKRETPVRVGYTSHGPDLNASLINDATKTACPLTTRGHHIVTTNTPHSLFYAELSSGQSRSWKINLARCYQLEAGNFTFNAKLRFEEKDMRRVDVTAKDVKFEFHEK